MAWFDLGEMVKLEHDTLKQEHREATQATTSLHVQADESEAAGDTGAARELRRVAGEIQVSANKRWYRSN